MPRGTDEAIASGIIEDFHLSRRYAARLGLMGASSSAQAGQAERSRCHLCFFRTHRCADLPGMQQADFLMYMRLSGPARRLEGEVYQLSH